jgi:phenylpropionate dioxygenase-like ring-hydroxylating dioxygenase large terminal subunit
MSGKSPVKDAVFDSPALRDFWYPVAPLHRLAYGPVHITLLGVPLVIWLARPEQPAALLDRCSHRHVALSLGQVRDGTLRCPYHGWAFAADGRCVHRPQLPLAAIPSSCHVQGFACRVRYGHAWVCLGEPRTDIPFIPESEDPAFRRIDCFYEEWWTSALRVMENELDMSHFAFVHRGTFGDESAPQPVEMEVTDRGPYEIGLHTRLQVIADAQQARNTQMAAGTSSRTMDITWFMPFTVRLLIRYTSGLRHVIVNSSVPVAPDRIQVVQFHFRSDREEDVPTAQLLAMERRIVAEDQRILEATDPYMSLDPASEAHMPTDRVGLLMRRKMRALVEGRTPYAPHAAQAQGPLDEDQLPR